MNVVVCVKQIPDPSTPGALDAQHRLERSGKLILDEADTYGVEVALQLVEASGEGEVALVSMGDASDLAGIRSALAMGAARATVVSDESLRGADALTTARVLAAAIRRHEADVVICATESSDGYTGTTPVQVAELLDWPALTFATHVSVDGDQVVIRRQTESGYDEVSATTPAVVTVTAGVVEPRYATFKGIMAAKSRPVDVRAAGATFVDEGDGAQRIVAYLEEIKVLAGGAS